MDTDLTQPAARMRTADAAALVRSHILAAKPFSLIRLGDGEGHLMGFPDLVSREGLDFFLKIWFGDDAIDDSDLRFLSEALRASVCTADIVGLPRSQQTRRNSYRTVDRAIERHGLLAPGQHITDAGIHHYFQLGNYYERMLSGVEQCTVIGPRRVAARLQAAFNIRQVDEFLLQGERFQPGDIELPPGEVSTRHFPDQYFELERLLKKPQAGRVFLIGAGPLGKIYAQWARQAGGVAIDVGSMMDAWGGVASRLRFIGQMDKFAPAITDEFAQEAALTNEERLKRNLQLFSIVSDSDPA
jgi:hypothetical protein